MGGAIFIRVEYHPPPLEGGGVRNHMHMELKRHFTYSGIKHFSQGEHFVQDTSHCPHVALLVVPIWSGHVFLKNQRGLYHSRLSHMDQFDMKLIVTEMKW